MANVASAFRSRYGVPALSVAIARSGSIEYEEPFAFADVEANKPTLPLHLYGIASLSKPITSAAIFDLIERGRLSLGDRVFGCGGVLGTTYGRSPYGRFVRHRSGQPRPETVRIMMASAANPGYAKGFQVNRFSNCWQTASLPGSVSILVRASPGFCWAALAKPVRPESDIVRALDDMVWAMIRQVPD